LLAISNSKGRPISFASLAEIRLKEKFLKSAKISRKHCEEDWKKKVFSTFNGEKNS